MLESLCPGRAIEGERERVGQDWIGKRSEVGKVGPR